VIWECRSCKHIVEVRGKEREQARVAAAKAGAAGTSTGAATGTGKATASGGKPTAGAKSTAKKGESKSVMKAATSSMKTGTAMKKSVMKSAAMKKK